jgi:hypothetical protein
MNNKRNSDGLYAAGRHILPLFPAVVLTACGPHEVYRVGVTGTDPAKDPGMVYYLPKTDVQVVVETRTTSRKAGPYRSLLPWIRLQADECVEEADRLSIASCVCGSDESSRTKPTVCGASPPAPDPGAIEVTSASLNAAAVPDPTETYSIYPANNRPLLSSNLSFEFTKEGLAVMGEGTVEDTLPDVIVSTVKTAASVVGAFFGTGAGPAAAGSARMTAPATRDYRAALQTCEPSEGRDKRISECTAAQAKMTDPCRRALTHPAAIKELEKANVTAAEVCGAAARLDAARKTRTDFLAAWEKADADTYTLVFTELEAEVNRLEELFGVKQTEVTGSRTISLPLKTGKQCLKKRDRGLSDQFATDCADGDPLSVEVSSTSWEMARCTGGQEKGFIYRLPATGSVTIGWKGQVSRTPLILPQFGKCLRAPNTIKGKEGKLLARISEETGMLLALELEQNADYSEEAQSIGDAATDVASKAASAANAKADATDALNVKKRELELLELQRSIDCYRTTGGPCAEPEKDE